MDRFVPVGLKHHRVVYHAFMFVEERENHVEVNE